MFILYFENSTFSVIINWSGRVGRVQPTNSYLSYSVYTSETNVCVIHIDIK